MAVFSDRIKQLTTALTWTVRSLQAWSVPWLQQRGADTPRLDSDLLLANALGVQRLDLFLDPSRPVSKRELATFKKHIQRRARREPVAYILGYHGFWQQDFIVTPDVLVPRPETELLVETVLEAFPTSHQDVLDSHRARLPGHTVAGDGDHTSQTVLKILEIGVGSGALLCSLLLEYPNARGTGIDISPTALSVAERNAKQHGCLERATLLLGDLVEPLTATSSAETRLSHTSPSEHLSDGHFQVIVSNPPYVTTSELASLEPEVRVWEPHQALDGGIDGLTVLRRLPSAVAPFLSSGGFLALEIGATQGEAVTSFMKTAGYQDVTLHLDFGRRPRVVSARRP